MKSVLSVGSYEEGATLLMFYRAVGMGPPMLMAPVNSTHYEHAPSQWATMGPLDNQPDRPPPLDSQASYWPTERQCRSTHWLPVGKREGKAGCWPMALMGPKGTEGNWLWPPMPYRWEGSNALCAPLWRYSHVWRAAVELILTLSHPHNCCHSRLICQQEAN